MKLNKLSIIIGMAIVLSGCSQSKEVESDVIQQSEVAVSAEVGKIIEEQIEDKIKHEEEEKQKAKQKVEQEDKLKQKQEEKKKVEDVAKANIEQKSKTPQESKAVVKSVPKPAPKPIPKVQEPVKPAVTSNGTSNAGLKHPVEYKSDIENEILAIVNQERTKAGLEPLVMNKTLRDMARYKSNDMLQHDYFDHTSPNIGGLSNLAKRFEYSYMTLGENIWMSKSSSASYLMKNITAVKIINGWMNSPGHRANIINSKFGSIGIGVTFSTDGFYHATQEFSN